ncbi:transposase family protein [Burkholderia pyrrocinia]|uniref:transposase family protein n=1 Tax=Burkholderia pyrrocinia TaxID=60550 RepID=UPI0030CE26BA
MLGRHPDQGESRLDRMRRYVPLGRGIPSNDTFGRVFAALDPLEFEACFVRWMRGLCQALVDEVGRHRRQKRARLAQRESAWHPPRFGMGAQKRICVCAMTIRMFDSKARRSVRQPRTDD